MSFYIRVTFIINPVHCITQTEEPNHLGVLVTHVDKASKFLVAGLAKNKTASEINPCHRKTFPRDSP